MKATAFIDDNGYLEELWIREISREEMAEMEDRIENTLRGNEDTIMMAWDDRREFVFIEAFRRSEGECPLGYNHKQSDDISVWEARRLLTRSTIGKQAEDKTLDDHIRELGYNVRHIKF